MDIRRNTVFLARLGTAFLLAILCLDCTSEPEPEPQSPVVLTIGQENISLDALQFYMNINYPELTGNQDAFLLSHAFDKFRRDLRIVQISRDLGFRITADQVEDFIKYNMTGSNLHLKPEAEQQLWRSEIKRRLAIKQFLQREILDDADISEEEISGYFEANQDHFKQNPVFLIRFVRTETDESAQAFRKSLRNSKKSFQEMAQTIEGDQSRQPAVPMTAEELPEPFRKAVSKMRPGQYSRVVPMQRGELVNYYVLYLESELPARQVPYEEAYQYIRQLLERDWCREKLEQKLERFGKRVPEEIFPDVLPFEYLDETARKEV